METTLSPVEIQVGLYVRPKRVSRTFFEVELREPGKGMSDRVVLRDVQVPADECIGDHGTIDTNVGAVLREYELVLPELEELAA